MEFRPQDIARLVLGYLKEQNYVTAYKEFLNNCPHLKHLTNNQKNKLIVTRLFGLSLTDYLSEYECLYNIIQEQLENTNFFKEHGSRTTLVVQLRYLLNLKASFESRTSTPIQDNHINKQNNPNNQRGNLSRSSEKIEGLVNSSNKSASSTEVQNETSQEEFEEIFTQTFLQNSQLIERLADNINKEVSSKSLSFEDANNFSIGQELDKNKIDTIVERIESDPVIVKLFDEITTLRPEDETEVPQSFLGTTDLEQNFCPSPKKVDKCASSDELIKKCRSTKKSLPALEHNSTIDDQNNAAIQSIIAASSCNDDKIVIQESNTAPQIDEIVNSSNYNNLINPPALLTQTNTNQMYVNTGAGCFLMLQNNTIAPTSNLLPSNNLQLDAPKPYYFIGQQPILNTKPNATPINFNSQDILNVPTLIMCETNQTSNTSTIVIPPVQQNESAEKYQSLSEYLTLYKCNDTFSTNNLQPQVETLSKHKPKKKIKRLLPKRAVSPVKAFQETHTTTTTTNVIIEVKRQEALPTISESKALDIPTDTINSMPTIGTPTTNIEIPKVGRSRSTPRNGSHIRQLDFSTPEKWSATNRRPNTSPKAIKNLNETPVKSSNRDTSKCRRSSLFTTDKKEDKTVEKSKKIEKSNKDLKEVTSLKSLQLNSKPSNLKHKKQKSNASSNSWDADLRALAGTSDADATNQKSTQKRNSDEKRKDKKQKKPTTDENLNSTEEDLIKFESALADIGTTIEDAEIIIPGLIERSENSKTGDVIVLGSEQECIDDNKIMTNETSQGVLPTTSQIKANEDLLDSKAEKDVGEEAKSVIADILPIKELNEAETINADVESNAHHSLNVPLTVDISNPYLTENLFTRNRNGKSRIKKKCNMTNVAQCSQSSDEIVLTHITKIKSCENLHENNKLILSPSKLNANKRNLLQVEHRPISSDVKFESTEKTNEKFVTPELIQISANMPQLGGAKRDISSLLETPFKSELSTPFPKTPGYFPSPLINTPFTQAVIEQLTEVDICAIPTPKFPITPNFPFTPAINTSEKSPFRNRTTDYSTSSSYYQPSDTEQNKSIEQLIEESKRLEQQGFAIKNESEEICDKDEPAQPIHKVVTANSIQDKTRAFNSSVIGRKNLHLIEDDEKEEYSSSHSSSSSSSSCTSSDDSDTTFGMDNSPVRVIKESPYSLRSKGNIGKQTLKKKEMKNVVRQIVKKKETENTVKQTSKKKETENIVKQPVKKKEMENIVKQTVKKKENENSNAAAPESSVANKSKPKSNKVVKLEVDAKLESSDLKKKENLNLNKNLEQTSSKLKPEKRAVKSVDPVKKQEVKKTVVTQFEVKQQKNESILEDGTKTARINQLLELEEKRQRTIAKFKSNNDWSSTSKATVRKVGKIRRIKTIKPKAKVITNKKEPLVVNKTEPLIINKTKPLTESNIEKQPNKNLSKSNEEPVLLHLSSDESLVKSFEITEAEPLISKSNPIEEHNEESNDTVDKEAETLVNGLKQWGIHLVHNKSKKSKLSQPKCDESTKALIIPESPIKKDTHDVTLEEGEILSDSSREDTNLKSANEVNYEAQFDIKNLNQEIPIIVYSDYKNTKRKPIKYNSEILTKTFSANVYISEIDAETEILLSISPMEFLLDLPTKSNSESTSKTKRKAINILANDVIKPSKKQSDEKLEKNVDKKSSEKSSKKREDVTAKKIVDKPPDVSKKIKTCTGSNEEKVLRKSTDEKQVQKAHKKSEDGKLKKSNNLKPLEDSKKNKSLKISEEKVLEHVEKSKEETSVALVAEKASSRVELVEESVSISDDLMNYAVIGSERVPENEEEPAVDAKKRKRSDSTSDKQVKKKKDEICHELLKSIDVDSFLKQLHGDK